MMTTKYVQPAQIRLDCGFGQLGHSLFGGRRVEEAWKWNKPVEVSGQIVLVDEHHKKIQNTCLERPIRIAKTDSVTH